MKQIKSLVHWGIFKDKIHDYINSYANTNEILVWQIQYSHLPKVGSFKTRRIAQAQDSHNFPNILLRVVWCRNFPLCNSVLCCTKQSLAIPTKYHCPRPVANIGQSCFYISCYQIPNPIWFISSTSN